MDEDIGVVSGRCTECGFEFPYPSKAAAEPAGTACPRCGATAGRAFEINASDSVTFHEYVKAKGKRPGKKTRPGRKRPYIETEGGEQFNHGAGKFVEKYVRIDRDKDEYEEIVTDIETGVTIHECREPLSEHRDHGSARSRKHDESG
ncbi:hypothetical protein R4P64_32135 [Rhodococcus sp. IEGM 1366]|uniref:hypothetical protein n=1 Tax=Rhodococcus sp. IEGM 1366 TaxID=3082223 RepID=UPI002953C395|nr:hypothetical protein [Rhodococcus sp. IEGM 1366]MDV8071169.1 hypothetical protein [Rhodococcus sp. IEGM 1366]